PDEIQSKKRVVSWCTWRAWRETHLNTGQKPISRQVRQENQSNSSAERSRSRSQFDVSGTPRQVPGIAVVRDWPVSPRPVPGSIRQEGRSPVAGVARTEGRGTTTRMRGSRCRIRRKKYFFALPVWGRVPCGVPREISQIVTNCVRPHLFSTCPPA